MQSTTVLCVLFEGNDVVRTELAVPLARYFHCIWSRTTIPIARVGNVK